MWLKTSHRVSGIWSLSWVDELRRLAAYYICCVIEMQKHGQNFFTVIETRVMWMGTKIISSVWAHIYTHACRNTQVCERGCNLTPCLKSFFSSSARIWTCLMQPREAQVSRDENVSHGCFLQCTLRCVCSQWELDIRSNQVMQLKCLLLTLCQPIKLQRQN